MNAKLRPVGLGSVVAADRALALRRKAFNPSIIRLGGPRTPDKKRKKPEQFRLTSSKPPEYDQRPPEPIFFIDFNQ